MLNTRGVFAVLIALLLLVSIFPAFVIAQDNSGSGSSDDVDSDDNSGSDSDDSDIENEETTDSNDEMDDSDDRLEREVESRDDRVEIRERIREVVGDCVIKIEKRIRIEDGEREERIERIRECADGVKEEVKFRIENRSDNGEVRERIKYEFKSGEREIEIEEGIEIEEDLEGSEYRLRAKLRDGNFTDIKIMPDVASEIALERLRANNFTVELREVGNAGERNIPRVVYHVESDKEGRFLGIFRMDVRVQGEIDPETGEVIEFRKPWWAFLVAGEDDANEGFEEETSNESASGIEPTELPEDEQGEVEPDEENEGDEEDETSDSDESNSLSVEANASVSLN